jgi:hypothetical protein
MLFIQIEKVWSNTIVLWFLPSDKLQQNEVFENSLWLWNLFDCLASMFRETFFMDNNKFILNFVTNLQGWGYCAYVQTFVMPINLM